MNMMSPPTGVHASPVATATSASRPATSLWTLGWPANFSRFFAVILMFAARPSTTSRAALRRTPWISRLELAHPGFAVVFPDQPLQRPVREPRPLALHPRLLPRPRQGLALVDGELLPALVP